MCNRFLVTGHDFSEYKPYVFMRNVYEQRFLGLLAINVVFGKIKQKDY